MEDRNRNKVNQSSDQNWDQNRNRYQDDQFEQKKSSNQGYTDLDGDGFIGNTGGFYGGTSYLGANYDDWNNNQGQGGSSSDQYRNQGQQHRNQQDYQNNQSRSGQSFNQGSSYGNQGMSGHNSNVNYGQGFDKYQDDDNRGQSHNRNDESHHYGAGGNYNRFGGWADNRISREQEQRADAYRNQLLRGQGNQGNESYRSGNQSNYQNRDQGNSWWDRATNKISSWLGVDDRNDRGYQQQNMTGPHRGKGPRGYQRSADRIRDDIHDRLHDDPYVDASEVEVEINQNEVILKGYVDSREAKRRAEDLVESVSGVRHVENRLRVGRPDTHGSGNSYQNTADRNQNSGTGDTEKDSTL